MTSCAAAPRLAIAARPMRPGDAPFVFRSWLKACRKCARHENMPSGVYYAEHHDLVEQLIAAPVVSLLLAVEPDNTDKLLGFICTERLAGSTSVLHFAYTKKDDRRRGVFSSLALASGLDLRRPFFYTAHPRSADGWARSFPKAVYRRDILGMAR